MRVPGGHKLERRPHRIDAREHEIAHDGEPVEMRITDWLAGRHPPVLDERIDESAVLREAVIDMRPRHQSGRATRPTIWPCLMCTAGRIPAAMDDRCRYELTYPLAWRMLNVSPPPPGQPVAVTMPVATATTGAPTGAR